MRLIRCQNCRKNFPFNPDKHKHDKLVFCPWCKNPIRNPARWILPKPNLSWIRRKLAAYKARKEGQRFIGLYFPGRTDIITLGQWRKGHRPSVSIEDVKRVVGKNKPQQAVEKEIARILKLGVKVRRQ